VSKISLPYRSEINLDNLTIRIDMINVFLEFGNLISEATKEVKQSHREMSVTKSLIAEGIVSSASMLS